MSGSCRQWVAEDGQCVRPSLPGMTVCLRHLPEIELVRALEEHVTHEKASWKRNEDHKAEVADWCDLYLGIYWHLSNNGLIDALEELKRLDATRKELADRRMVHV